MGIWDGLDANIAGAVQQYRPHGANVAEPRLFDGRRFGRQQRRHQRRTHQSKRGDG
jgi:hypothetical protein